MEVVQWIEAVDAPPLCSRQFDNVVRSKVKELVVGKTEQINAQDVVDVAFVFTPEVLQHFWTDVAGMKQVFFTRVPNHAPFSPIVVDSYPSRIWFSLLIVKDIVRRILSSKRQYQICKGSTSTMFSLEAWKYLCQKFPSSQFQKRQTKIYQYSDLSLESKSSIRIVSMIRLMAPDTMNIARDVFGNTFGIGTRNLPPRKGMPRKVLQMGNIMNVVNASDFIGEPNVKELIPNQRIDLLYEEIARTLTIRVKYSDCRAEDAMVARMLDFAIPAPQNAMLHPQPKRVRKAIPIDTTFVFNDKYFIVNMSDGVMVRAVCVDDGEELRITNEEL